MQNKRNRGVRHVRRQAAQVIFLLRPVEEENDRVYIPVDNADKRIRKVITQDEALAVLDRVPEIEALAVNTRRSAKRAIRRQSEAVSRIV